MHKLERLYGVSPIWMQNLMCSVKGYLLQRRRFNHDFRKELYRFETGLYKPRLQLIKVLNNATAIVCYKPYLTDGRLNCQTEDNVCEMLQDLPIIDKNTVKADIAAFTNTIE